MPDVNDIMRFEQGEMEEDEVYPFFQKMIDSGMVWNLQGSYGRAAANLIAMGYCTDTHGVLNGR